MRYYNNNINDTNNIYNVNNNNKLIKLISNIIYENIYICNVIIYKFRLVCIYLYIFFISNNFVSYVKFTYGL